MKCPKCGYLGFESPGRCRNCGYDFSLAPPEAVTFDLALQPDLEPLGPPPDLSLGGLPDSAAAIPSRSGQPLDLDRIIGAPSAADLPLFGGSPTAAAPPIASPSRPGVPSAAAALGSRPGWRPRAPLAVRRATPEIPRAKMQTGRPQADTLFEPPVAQLGIAPENNERSGAGRRGPASGARFVSGVQGAPRVKNDARRAEGEAVASPARRMLAALVDLTLLIAVDTAVLYLTLRLCGLTPADIRVLPPVPLAAFFTLLNGGYFVAFTAVGGQSIGKMAAGIKVISQEDHPVAFTGATLRTLGYLASALPLGAGFLPGLFGSEKLALHDRLARTRVVRPSSR